MVSLSHFVVDYWYFCTFRRGSRKLNRHYLRKIPRIDTKFRLCRALACPSNDSHEKQDIIQIFPNYFVAHMNLVSNDRQAKLSSPPSSVSSNNNLETVFCLFTQVSFFFISFSYEGLHRASGSGVTFVKSYWKN